MINIGSNSNKIAYGIKHFNLDEVVDLAELNKATLTPGSTVFIISTSKHYMLNGNKKWVEIQPFCQAGGGSGGGGGSDNDYIYDGGSIDGSDPTITPPGGDSSNDNVYDGGSIDGSDPL